MDKPRGLRVGGSRATEVIEMPDGVTSGPFESRWRARVMAMDEFIEHKGSGTLRKNKAIGMNVFSHALHERVAYEFGYEFQACAERFVTWGEPRSEGDSKALTETGWFVERYASVCLFPGDEMEVKYITAEINGEEEEGIGIVIRKTSVPWLPKGYMVFAIIARYNPAKGDFDPVRNPC